MYYLSLTYYGELERYEEETQVETRKKWEKGVKEEMESLVHKQTWDSMKFPVGKIALKNKCIYNLKEKDGGK